MSHFRRKTTLFIDKCCSGLDDLLDNDLFHFLAENTSAKALAAVYEKQTSRRNVETFRSVLLASTLPHTRSTSKPRISVRKKCTTIKSFRCTVTSSKLEDVRIGQSVYIMNSDFGQSRTRTFNEESH